MLIATRRVDLFDRFRVPYEIADERGGPLRLGRSLTEGAELISVDGRAHGIERFYTLDGTPLFVALADEEAIAGAMSASGRQRWRADTPVVDAKGVPHGYVRRAPDGSVLLPFDLDAPLQALLQERYMSQGGSSRARSVARDAYYRLRPVIPRGLQLALRRRFRLHQDKALFPAWPTETALHRLEALLLQLVEEVVGEPLPWLAPWPNPFDWALVLTHDVEHARGYERVPEIRSVEAQFGLRSAWYFVPERDYRVEDSLLQRLRSAECEIGLHGLHHDGLDMSPKHFGNRLAAMRSYADRWGAKGFRGPATHRDRTLLQALGVEYDSSWSDVARYEPQPGGSCSWLPFFIGDVVELPITLPMDHTLYELLEEDSPSRWYEKTAFLRAQGGMALMLTHPDYLLEPKRLSAYSGFIGEHAGDPTAWHALPAQVAAWWRKRAQTSLEHSGGGWFAKGPAASEVNVRLGAPPTPSDIVSLTSEASCHRIGPQRIT